MRKKIRTAVLVVPFHFRAIAPSERTVEKRREREKGGGNGRNERRSVIPRVAYVPYKKFVGRDGTRRMYKGAPGYFVSGLLDSRAPDFSRKSCFGGRDPRGVAAFGTDTFVSVDLCASYCVPLISRRAFGGKREKKRARSVT